MSGYYDILYPKWMKPKLTVVSIKMDHSLVELLDQRARELGINRSELIRLAVEVFLSMIME